METDSLWLKRDVRNLEQLESKHACKLCASKYPIEVVMEILMQIAR